MTIWNILEQKLLVISFLGTDLLSKRWEELRYLLFVLTNRQPKKMNQNSEHVLASISLQWSQPASFKLCPGGIEQPRR